MSFFVPYPIIKYAGGKAQLADKIIRRFPTHFLERYYEPFFGGGAVLFAAIRDGTLRVDAHEMFVNDSNPHLVNVYRSLKHKPQATMRLLDELADLPATEETYMRIRQDYNAGCVPQFDADPKMAARFIYMNKTGFNGLCRFNRKGKFNVPWGKRKKTPALYDQDVFADVSDVLAHVDLSCRDFEEVFDEMKRGDFAYIDPPYVPASATAKFTSYGPHDFVMEDHRRLAEAVRDLDASGVRFLLSNSDTGLVRELYSGFKIETVSVRRAINCDGEKRGPVGEVLVRNY